MTTVSEPTGKRYESYLKRLRNFRLLDDTFMTKCFESDPACAELVLRILLDKPDLQIAEVRTQVLIENLLSRSVRLDIRASDSAGRIFNIEVQRENRGADPKRARYHTTMIDMNLLEKNADFGRLPETWVIFITERDVLGKGLALYPVERCILSTGELFNDGTHILYVNGAYRDDSPIGKLMHDFSCADPSKMHYKVLSERTRFFKENREGVAVMCQSMEELWQEGRQEGRQEGKLEERRETARYMLGAGKYTLEEIAAISRLPLEEIRQLRKTEKSAASPS